MNNFWSRADGLTDALSQGCGILAAGFGFVALLGWILAIPFWTSFGSHLIPMAPSTALLFGLLGTATFFRARFPQNRTVRWICMAVGAFSALAATLLFCLSFQGLYPSVEHLGLSIAGLWDGAPVGHMSPVTALSFVFAGSSLLASLSSAVGGRGRKGVAFGLASLVIAANYVFALSYFVGTPFLYGGSFIPLALPTSLAFVALGISLAAMVRKQAVQPGKLTVPVATRASYSLLLVFILLTLGIVTAGHYYYRNIERHYRTEVERQLAAIAELKTGEIRQWRKERLSDASVFYKNAVFSLLAERYLNHPNDREAEKQLRAWMQRVRTAYQYDRLCLSDVGNRERISVPETRTPATTAHSRRASEVLRSGKIVFEDFYRGERDGKVYLNMLVPVFNKDNRNTIGILAMRIDPEKYLYPLISRWPTPSRTAETLIVRREGNEVVFLNELRFQKNTALKLRVSSGSRGMPAFQATMGRTGIVEGPDYRGVPVVAYVGDIPDSPWFLVARMDVSEVYAPLRERLWIVVLLVGVLLLGAGAVMGLIWRHQRARLYREKYEAAEALRESMEIQRTIVETSPVSIIVTDPEGKVTLWNSAAERTFGWRSDEAVGKQNPVFPPERADDVGKARRLIMDGRTPVDVETECVRKDGERVAVSFSTTALRDAGGRTNAILSIVVDITKRKQAEEDIRRLNRVLSVLSDINQAIVRIREPQTLFDEACRIAVEKGNFSLAWIGLLDEPSQEIRVVAHAGRSEGFLNEMDISLKDRPSVFCPIDNALREKKHAICKTIGLTDDPAPCQKIAHELGFRSSASFPLLVFGRIRGLVNLYADNPDHFDEAELRLLDEMAMDISFAMEFAEKEAESAQAEEASRISHRFLEIVHNHTEMQPLLEEYVSEIKSITGCEAVGIRVLDDEGGIPYQAYEGFSRKFFELENPLSIVSDHCMCINVITGAVDPKLPFYSEGGSFFMNATTRFLATVSEEEKGTTRNECNREGYESVALVPFRMENRTLGLIHVADHRENMVPLRMVEILEKAAMQLGTTIQRVRADGAVRKSERRYRSLFENMLEGYAYCRMIFDGESPRDFLYLDVNKSFSILTGMENVVGKNVSELIPGLMESNPGLLEIYGRVALTGMSERFEEYVAPLGRWFSVAAYSPEKGYFIAVFDNITERKNREIEVQMLNSELEERVRNRTAQLEAANKELEAFAYSVSHDLRAPLRAIDGYSQIVLEEYSGKIDAEADRLLNIICANAKKMDHLITDLLALSRASRGDVRISRIDMTALAGSIYHEVASAEIRQKFSFSVTPLPVACGDPSLMRQVWYNLLSNAVKYTMPKEERRIEIGGHTEQGMAVYFVKDSGVGFNPAYTHKLFGVFQRLHKDTEFEGTGVGLAIVQRIIDRHGGRVWAEGKVNGGAIFSFSLPRRETNHESG